MSRKTNHAFLARRHRYADGVYYNKSRYDLLVNIGDDTEPHYRTFGGMLVLRDKAIAYIGATSLSSKVKDITGHADTYVWGSTVQEALAKIKPHLIEAATAYVNRSIPA